MRMIPMSKEVINLLFAIDDQFVWQMMTTLLSAKTNTPGRTIKAFVISKEPLEKERDLLRFGDSIDVEIEPIYVGTEAFEKAPVTKRWPESIYYRLLAHNYLPDNLSRILYLDADILVINDLSDLYDMDMKGHMYVASQHSAFQKFTDNINKVRLNNYDMNGYFNSGVILMDLNKKCEIVREEDIIEYISAHHRNLLLPDQDVLNGMYSQYTLSVPERIYNYDTRYPVYYEATTFGAFDLETVIQKTVILHFCGKEKPWFSGYTARFSALYKHYWFKAQHILETR